MRNAALAMIFVKTPAQAVVLTNCSSYEPEEYADKISDIYLPVRGPLGPTFSEHIHRKK